MILVSRNIRYRLCGRVFARVPRYRSSNDSGVVDTDDQWLLRIAAIGGDVKSVCQQAEVGVVRVILPNVKHSNLNNYCVIFCICIA